MLLPGIEEIVAYLTRCESVFVSSSLVIDRTAHPSYSPPDILALDFRLREVVIVDVVPAWDLTQLRRRIEDREDRWCHPVRATLLSQHIVTESWSVRVLILLPDRMVADARHEFADLEDVTCWPLEDVAGSDEEACGGTLPRRQAEA